MGRHHPFTVRSGSTVTACLLLFASIAHACLYGRNDSVHFHSGMPDFGTPPRRAALRLRGEDDDRRFGTKERLPASGGSFMELSTEADMDAAAVRKARRTVLLQRAQQELSAGHWSKARITYEQSAQVSGWNGNTRDRVEVLRRIESMAHPSTALLAALQTYLQGLDWDDAKRRNDAQDAFQKVYEDPSADFLREHALYQQASLAYEWLDYPRAVAMYQRVLREFPQSEKREATLIMTARCALLPATPEGRDPAAGQQALALLEKEFPHTRFRRAILGLRACQHTHAKRWEEALWCYATLEDMPSMEIVCKAMPPEQQGQGYTRLLVAYLRQMMRAKTYDAYERAVFGIDHTRSQITPADSTRFLQLLLEQPEIASPYFYYRLYHCDNSAADLQHLVRLADRIVARHPAVALPPLVRVRLAEVYYQHRQYDRALAWANRAFVPASLDRALFVRGATLHKLKRTRAALADFNTLLRDCPRSPLRRGAREEAAILSEALDDLGGALEHYFALDYTHDIAFLLDVRMTPGQIETFVRRHPHHGQRDLLAYTLGIRYLREEKWTEADRWLRRVPHAKYLHYSAGRREWADLPSPDPLVAVRELGTLHRAIAWAKTNNARAAALYRYASYYSTHGTLLLYNPALWKEAREFSFQFWWNTSHATQEDLAAVRKHMYRHEVYARAREICLEIVRRYPHAPVAPQALYRAGCAARRLASFNTWWDEEDNKHYDYWDESVRLMQRVVSRYPNDPVAQHARKYAQVFAQERPGAIW